MERASFDMVSYFETSRSRCFVCAFLAGDPDYPHTTLYDDGEFVAFLNRYPTLRGQALVVPRRHVEHVLTDLDEGEYARFMAVVRRVGLAMQNALPTERLYLLSLGSMQANRHVHFHVAALPPGVPLEQQQYYALDMYNGVCQYAPGEEQELAQRIAAALG
ncbi:MAG: hypothetical protein QOJ79_2686 [Actinomycetota bacterium]|jgi:diadenosine tetraphosphate (Ap4A) HIT family hydrolase|nr:hypothetical protein [Actinomycetota bacterium]